MQAKPYTVKYDRYYGPVSLQKLEESFWIEADALDFVEKLLDEQDAQWKSAKSHGQIFRNNSANA